MNQEAIKAQLKAQFGDRTDLANVLSYDGKVKNIFGIRDTKSTIRIKVNNPTDNDILIHFMANQEVTEGSLISLFKLKGLPTGYIFTGNDIPKADEGEPQIQITSLNPEQELVWIASEAIMNPIFIREVSFKSYQLTENGNRIPDDSNFGNAINHYHMNSITGELEKDNPLHLGATETRKDVNTSVMKVDFIAEKFYAGISKNDVTTFQVNAKTQLEITLKIGARFSAEELLYRMVTGGMDVLTGGTPTECGCK